MPITALDSNCALIIIDLQKGILALPAAHPIDGVVAHARALAEAFRGKALPVVLVNVAGGAPGRTEQPRRLSSLPDGWSDLVAELAAQPEDHRVTKRTWGAFTDTDLADYLKQRDVTQLVVVGVATSIGVETTARQAYELGFNVTLAVDAMTDGSLDAHANSVTRIFPRLGETGTTQEIVERLEQIR